MAVETHTLEPARPRPRAELVLAVLAVASLALIPVQITTIYSGLPAHPLFLHVPVILIPVATIWALVLVARPRLIARQGVALGTVTVAALAGTFLTVGAGIALRNALHLNGPATGFGGASGPAALIARHQHAGMILRDLMIVFTATVLLTLLAYRIAAGIPTGRAGLDRVLSGAAALVALRVLLAVLAVACGYFVFHTGDLGAKAVWSGRLNRRGGFGGPQSGFGFPGSNRSSGGAFPSGSGAP